ncbi:MAG: arylesterase [Balneolaceae bacterium]|nr:arylesterase [Balneolaceae bacterium]
MNVSKVTSLVLTIFFTFASAAAQDNKTILFFGDSITAGYGLEEDQAFPAIIQEKIDENGLSYRVVNAGSSGETSAGGLRRVDWILQQQVDVFVLELGGNDGLRGIDPQDTKKNLQGIMDKVRETYPEVTIVLTGMEAPPNMGSDYTEAFRTIYTELAEANDVVYMPFILEGVAGEPDLNLPDGIHPTEEGHEIIANNLWEILQPIL